MNRLALTLLAAIWLIPIGGAVSVSPKPLHVLIVQDYTSENTLEMDRLVVLRSGKLREWITAHGGTYSFRDKSLAADLPVDQRELIEQHITSYPWLYATARRVVSKPLPKNTSETIEAIKGAL